MRLHYTQSTLTVVTLALVGMLWALVLREAWRGLLPARLIALGRYAEAQAAAERIQGSWRAAFPSVRRGARYAIGCAQHFQGDLEGSVATLGPLHEENLRGPARYALCSLHASSLVLLGRDPERAEALLEEAAHIRREPEDLLLAALVKLELGHPDRARALFEEAREARIPRKVRIAFIDEHRHRQTVFHALRGLYLVTVGRRSDAERDLELAATSPLDNVYVARARALRAASPSRNEPGDEGPSSLAPHVVAAPSRTSE
jgi:hypothetical protein